MKKIYEPYWKWEDFQNGMYDLPRPDREDALLAKAAELLRDRWMFKGAVTRLIREWPVAAAVNLTNRESNRRAWIGQAACCLLCNVPEVVTRKAWKSLTDEERRVANRIAEKAIRFYERKNQKVRQGVEGSRLF